MDITTLMMSSMPQTAATTVAGGNAPVQTGQAGDLSAKALLFSTLLGTSLQGQLPVPVLQTNIEGQPPVMDLKAMTALLSQLTEADMKTAEMPATGTIKMEDVKALSVMQLLQDLKGQLENPAGNISAVSKGETSQAGVDQLTAELRSLFGQDGQLLPELEKKLKGRINPAVTGKESQLEAVVKEASDKSTDETGAVDQLAELLIAINGMLPKNPVQAIEKKVDMAGDAKSSVTAAVPEVVVQQQNAAEKQNAGQEQNATEKQNAGQEQNASQDQKLAALTMPKTGDSEKLPMFDSKADAVKPESGKSDTTPLVPADLKVVDSTKSELQQKPVKAANSVVQLHPSAVQLPESGDNQAVQPKEALKPSSIEIVVKEEESMQELTQPAVRKLEPAASDKRELFRIETPLAVSADVKSQQVSTDRPVAEAPLVSREQIVSQVREKLAEHRFTQDNGQITIRLNPAELGELKISVRMDDQRLRVEIVAENRTVKDALMENLGSLKEALAKQNLEMKQFDVSTGSKQFFNQGFREGRQQEQQVAPRQAGWLMGRMGEPVQSASVSWQPRDNALLDMMM